jgi:hypothetical protein
MTGLRCAGRVVAGYVVQPELALDLSPRPYLHPVRTLAGVTVTDAVPRDHPWHLGVSVGVQHVQIGDGRTVNFWGGRTYLADRGYTWLDDHGRVDHIGWTRCDPTALEQELAWRVPGGPVLLRESRTLTTSPLFLDGDPDRRQQPTAWRLRIRFELENITSTSVSLGSPGTRGRAGAGYGGFFWRTAPAEQIRVQTAEACGEEAVHGKPADWLTFGGIEPGTGRDWSLLLAGEDAATRADPWFVRVGDYPGVGSALAYERPIVLDPGAGMSRSLSVTVLDGILGREKAFSVVASARGK